MTAFVACLESADPIDPGGGSDAGADTSNVSDGAPPDSSACSTVPSAACQAYAQAYVDLYTRCGFAIPPRTNPYSNPPVAADFETWKAGLAIDCARDDNRPDALPMTPSCAVDLAALDCDAVEELPDVASCARKGVRTDGALCDAAAQCESGTCLAVGPIYGTQVQRCLTCGGEGSSCGEAHGQYQGCCLAGLGCTTPGGMTLVCAKLPPRPPPIQLGEECTRNDDACDLRKNLQCAATGGGPAVCAERPMLAEGEACEPGRRCAVGLHCAEGTCVRNLAEGAPCTADGECTWPAQCTVTPDGQQCLTRVCP